MQNKIDLNNMSIEQCKALAYDLIAQKEKVQHDLNLVNKAIADKTNELNKIVQELANEQAD